MRILIYSLIILFDFFVSSTWLQHIAVGGIMPNTTLIILVSYALLRDDVEGTIMGFCAGLLYDIFFGRIIGMSAMLMMLTGFFVGKPFRDFFKDNYIAPIIMVAAATLAYELAYYILNFLLLGRTNIFRYLGMVILPSVAYNLILCIFIYRAIYAIDGIIFRREERKRGFMK
ncbi:MAG: rod shape-determining protein MreD [Defluviitaleaceae bacterium]|nr:rod shape-determining protein MreD [Defluviitaleaceae bacterium]